MDRMYRAIDKVIVYASPNEYAEGVRLHGFRQKAYSMNGYDCYKYKNTFYPGFQDRDTGEVYILLSHPLPPYSFGA